MAVLACAYGVLGPEASGIPSISGGRGLCAVSKAAPLNLFVPRGRSRACFSPAHPVSTAVGLLYGAMLPMLARRPILFGRSIAACLWSDWCTRCLASSIPRSNSHRLVLVHGVAGGVRRGRGSRGSPAAARPYPRESVSFRAPASRPRARFRREMEGGRERPFACMDLPRSPWRCSPAVEPTWRRNGGEVGAKRGSGFRILYAQNCAACHGKDGRGGLRSPSVIPSIRRSPARRRYDAGSPTAWMEPPCRPSPRAPVEC